MKTEFLAKFITCIIITFVISLFSTAADVTKIDDFTKLIVHVDRFFDGAESVLVNGDKGYIVDNRFDTAYEIYAKNGALGYPNQTKMDGTVAVEITFERAYIKSLMVKFEIDSWAVIETYCGYNIYVFDGGSPILIDRGVSSEPGDYDCGRNVINKTLEIQRYIDKVAIVVSGSGIKEGKLIDKQAELRFRFFEVMPIVNFMDPPYTQITVTSNDDNGPGTLRQAIADIAPGGLIDFAFSHPTVITLTSGELGIDKAMTIIGPSASWLAISGNDTGRVIRIDPLETGEVHIQGLAIEHGYASEGAGILNQGKLRLSEVELRNNQVMGNNARGGGVYNDGELVIESSTIYNNEAAAFATNDYAYAGGGGICNRGILQLSNSTVSENSVYCLNSLCRDRKGGGILNYSYGSISLVMSTIAYNETDESGGGIFNWEGEFYTYGSILANNDENNCSHTPIQTEGYNLDSDGSCELNGPGDINVDPQLGSLADNGGPTLTHALLTGSPAIDTGSCPDFTADQRGFQRPVDIPYIPNVDDGCDIGAFEVQKWIYLPLIMR